MTIEQIPDVINAMAAMKVHDTCHPWKYTVKPLAMHDVDIKITYNGICGTDLHMIDNDWGWSRYPIVPGHEVVGHVINVGPEVTNFKVGDVVGLGALVQYCGKCEWCKCGKDNCCPSRKWTYMENTVDETGIHQSHGGFSSYLRCPDECLFIMPKGVSEPYFGPLMCAGITVGGPLYEYCNNTWDARGKHITIVGLGGLGHLAVQFAAKMGAVTSACSRGQKKAEFAAQLGATNFIDFNDEESMKKNAKTQDFVLMCIGGGEVEINKYMTLLRPYGTIHFVGVPDSELKINATPMIFDHLQITGSPVGSVKQMHAMLNFAGENNISPIIEVFPHTHCNEAIQKVRDNTIRFRAVLSNNLL